VHAAVEQARQPAVQDGRAGGERGDDGEQEPDRRVQAGELGVAVEGEVGVDALQVRPPVPARAEDAVEGAVDGVVLVRPQHGLPLGIHPRVRGGRHETAADGHQDVSDGGDVACERGVEAAEPARRPVGLQLDHVVDELVGPRQVALLDLGDIVAGHREENLVGGGEHVERVGVDDHVLELDPEAFEEVERHDAYFPRKCRMRRWRDFMMRR